MNDIIVKGKNPKEEFVKAYCFVLVEIMCTCANPCQIAAHSVQYIEANATLGVGVAAEEGGQGLEEGQQHCQQAEQGVEGAPGDVLFGVGRSKELNKAKGEFTPLLPNCPLVAPPKRHRVR